MVPEYTGFYKTHQTVVTGVNLNVIAGIYAL